LLIENLTFLEPEHFGQLDLYEFFKTFFLYEYSSLIKIGKHEPIVESDMPSLPHDLNPRSYVFKEDQINWSHPRAHLWSLLKISKSKLIPAYLWYFLSSILSLATPYLVHRFVSLISQGVTSENLLLPLELEF